MRTRPKERVLAVAALAASFVLTGCGDEEPAGLPVATDARPSATETVGLRSLGCDVEAQCFPLAAEQTLKRCPASRLDTRGREARRRLERLLARIVDVDLHNEQAYEASDAVVAALAELERACL